MWKERILQIQPRWWLCLCGAAAIVVAAAVATPLLAQSATYKQYGLPANLHSIAVDPSGNVWATTNSSSYFFKLDPTINTLTTYSHGMAFGEQYGIASDSAGKIWFANKVGSDCRINRFDPNTREITSWTWGTSNCDRWAVAVDGPGDNVWFNKPNAVARLEPSTNTITTWPLSYTPASLACDTVDSVKRVWLLGSSFNMVGMLLPATNSLTEWPLPGTTHYGGIHGLSLDSEHRAWFAAQNVFINPETVDVIARLDAATNEMTKWVCPPGACNDPGSVAVGSDGMVWFGETGAWYDIVQRLEPTASPPRFTRWNVDIGSFYIRQVISDGSGGAFFIYEGVTARLHRLQPY